MGVFMPGTVKTGPAGGQLVGYMRKLLLACLAIALPSQVQAQKASAASCAAERSFNSEASR